MNMQATVENDPRWQSVVNRDSAADHVFVYAVKTTGTYCKPSCPSRRANPENVMFFNSAKEAEKIGFRACRRCDNARGFGAQIHADAIARACQIIAASEEPPKLRDLARAVCISTYHFHRIFKSVTGITPKGYYTQHRLAKIREGLRTPNTSVTDAIFDAGFNSSSRFYEKANGALGMSPTAYRDGGTGTTIQFAIAQCSLSAILVAKSDIGICAIALDDDPEILLQQLQDDSPKATLLGGDREFEQFVALVIGFIEQPKIGLDLPLDLRGTAFQHRVWQALMQIPAGGKVSYSDIAERIGAPKAVRAVAQACRANKVAVAVPCHRVVRNDGSLSGYRWGIERKRALLEREATE